MRQPTGKNDSSPAAGGRERSPPQRLLRARERRAEGWRAWQNGYFEKKKKEEAVPPCPSRRCGREAKAPAVLKEIPPPSPPPGSSFRRSAARGRERGLDLHSKYYRRSLSSSSAGSYVSSAGSCRSASPNPSSRFRDWRGTASTVRSSTTNSTASPILFASAHAAAEARRFRQYEMKHVRRILDSSPSPTKASPRPRGQDRASGRSRPLLAGASPGWAEGDADVFAQAEKTSLGSADGLKTRSQRVNPNTPRRRNSLIDLSEP